MLKDTVRAYGGVLFLSTTNSTPQRHSPVMVSQRSLNWEIQSEKVGEHRRLKKLRL
jgi:hypothetical protein